MQRDESSGPFKGAASAGIVVPLEVRTNLPPQPAATHVPTVDGGSGSNAHDSGSGSSDHDGKEVRCKDVLTCFCALIQQRLANA